MMQILVEGVVDAVLLKSKLVVVAQPKSHILASTTELANRVKRQLAARDLHFPAAKLPRDLGVSTSFGEHRTSTIADARVRNDASRYIQIAELAKQRRGSKTLATVGALPQATWGLCVPRALCPIVRVRSMQPWPKTVGHQQQGACDASALLFHLPPNP
jgi:hypothetical protein